MCSSIAGDSDAVSLACYTPMAHPHALLLAVREDG
jgi:hypothetical protein